jgi:hypothetical protein
VLVAPGSLIIFTMMIQAIRSSEMSVRTRATRRHIPDDGILQIHRRENFKSYKIALLMYCNEGNPILVTPTNAAQNIPISVFGNPVLLPFWGSAHDTIFTCGEQNKSG